MLGKTLSHYKILQKLGEGGMGVVYLAEDTKLKRQVALKFISPQAHVEPEDTGRLLHEARLAAALNHPNICTIYEIDTVDDQTFISIEYVEGQNLKEWRQSNPPSLATAIEITRQIASGLLAAHEQGIVHQDIKSANIMLNAQGQAKIMDFGLARQSELAQARDAHTTFGTVAYMSPEQAMGDEVNHKTDIWALGIILYELLAGEPPFLGEFEHAVVYSIVNTPHNPVTKHNPAVPPELEKIVDKLLAKTPHARYGSLKDLLRDLERVAESIHRKADDRIFAHLPKPLLFISVALVGLIAFGVLPIFQPEFNSNRREIVKPKKLDKRRIAVLPLDNISLNPEDAYFADGLTDELIALLSKIKGLQVIARSSVMRYKNSDKGIADIAAELEVGSLMEGSVRQEKNALRIIIKLVDANSQVLLWSQDYKSSVRDIFEIQEDIARHVRDALQIQLLTDDRRQSARKPVISTKAYNYYLKGRYFSNKRDVPSLQRSLGYFKQAITLEPEFALAYVGLAASLGLLEYFSAKADTVASQLNQVEMLYKAISLDSSLADAHAALGSKLNNQWRWLEADALLRRALELNPNDAVAHHWYSYYLMTTGEIEAGISQQKLAVDLDPLSLVINASMGRRYYWAGRTEEALTQLEKTLELDSSFAVAHLYKGFCLDQLGKCEQAVAAFKTAIRYVGESPAYISALGQAYAACGDMRKARKILEDLLSPARSYQLSNYHIALLYAALGESDNLFEWLNKAFDAGDSNLTRLQVDPKMAKYRTDARFRAILKKMRVPSPPD